MPTQTVLSRFAGALCVGLVIQAVGPVGRADAVVVPERVVAVSGTPAPGTTGVVFHVFEPPVLNGAGEVAFRASLDGPGAVGAAGFGAWSEGLGGVGALALELRGGDPAPAALGPLTVETILSSPRFGDAGHIGFLVKLDGPGVTNFNDTALLVGLDGLVSIAREGTPAPAGPDEALYSFIEPGRINGAGRIAYRAGLKNQFNQSLGSGIWTGFMGEDAGVLVAGDVAPGLGAGITIVSAALNFSGALINDTGSYIVAGVIDGPDVDQSNNNVVWIGPSEALEILLREGDPPFVNDPSILAGTVGSTQLNDAGDATVSVLLSGPGVSSENDAALLFGRPGALNMIAREGEPAPGLANKVFAFFLEAEPLDDGRILLRANVRTAGDPFSFSTPAVWVRSAGETPVLELIAATGQQAPGLPEGVLLTNDLLPSINANGMVAIAAELTGVGINGDNDRAIFVPADGNAGGLRVLLRESDTIDLDLDPVGEDLRVVERIGLGGLLTRPVLNDLGQIAVNVRFTDDSEAVIVLASGPEAPACPADLTGDGSVDTEDLGVLLGAFGSSADGDVDGDGVTDTVDLGLLLGGFGVDCR